MPLIGYYVFFVLLCLSDILLTYTLIGHQDIGVYEANPLAALMLQQGWLAVILWKIWWLIVYLATVKTIEYLKPTVAKRVAIFACIVQGLVVIWSMILIITLKFMGD